MSDATFALDWLDERTFRVGTTEFFESYTRGSTAERFHIRKNRELVEAYLEKIRPFRGGAVVEVGIADGGSAALMELVASPRKLVALELDPNPLAGLTAFIERHGVGDRIRPYYGVDQGDRARVLELVTHEFGGAPLDLVIDDASHLLEPTLATFETLFPLVRPGGRYLIEDWCWQVTMGDQLVALEGTSDSEASEAALRAGLEQVDESVFRDAVRARLEDPDPEVRARIEAYLQQPAGEGRDHGTPTAGGGEADEPGPLPAMAIDLLLARATSGDVIADVHVDGFWISVTRGPADLDPETFRLADTFVDHLGLGWSRPE